MVMICECAELGVFLNCPISNNTFAIFLNKSEILALPNLQVLFCINQHLNQFLVDFSVFWSFLYPILLKSEIIAADGLGGSSGGL